MLPRLDHGPLTAQVMPAGAPGKLDGDTPGDVIRHPLPLFIISFATTLIVVRGHVIEHEGDPRLVRHTLKGPRKHAELP